MQIETVRVLCDAATDETLGVAQQLLTLPHDVDDVVPTTVMIVDATRDEALASGNTINRGKDIMILIAPDGAIDLSPEAIKGEFSVGAFPVAFTIVHRGSGSEIKKAADVMYVMRAIVLMLKTFFGKQDAVPRVRNEVTVMRVLGGTYGLTSDDGHGRLGAVVVRIQALDKRAQRLF